MKRLVLDASVAAKWFLPRDGEPLAAEAHDLLGRCQRGDVEFIVPDLFWPEVASVLSKAVRQGRVEPGAAARWLNELAATLGRSAHDAAYLALALAEGIDLITADERLVNALGGRMPVKWLAAI